jgi:ribosomal protein L16 Arg81 hydroxylase
VLVSNGYSRETALAEVQKAATNPYLIGCAQLQQPLAKALSLLHIQDQLARLHSQAGIIERRTGLSRADFRDEFYAINRPVLIEDLMTEWPAMTSWTPDYLKNAVGNRIVEVMTGRDADPRRRYVTEMGFATYVDMVCSGKVTNEYHMTPSNRLLQRPEAEPLLRDFTAFPEYLPPLEGGAACFLWFDPAGTITPLHYETRNILLAQVTGRKHYRLVPAAQRQYVYNTLGAFSEVDCERPNYRQFPKFRHATVVDVLLQPGEVLFVPVGWWHHVRALDISTTICFTNFVFPNSFTWEGQ